MTFPQESACNTHSQAHLVLFDKICNCISFTSIKSVGLSSTLAHCSGGIICVLWYGARLVVENKLSPGELSTFVIYAVYVGSNVGALAGVVSSLVQVCNSQQHSRSEGRLTSTSLTILLHSLPQLCFVSLLQAVGASTRVFTLLDRRPQMVPAGHAKPQGSPEGAHVEFRNVSFAYPSRPDIQVHCLALYCPALSSLCQMQQCLGVFQNVVDTWLFTCCKMPESVFA